MRRSRKRMGACHSSAENGECASLVSDKISTSENFESKEKIN